MFGRRKTDGRSMTDGVEPYFSRQPETPPTVEPAPRPSETAALPADLLTVGQGLDFERAQPYFTPRAGGPAIGDALSDRAIETPLPADYLMLSDSIGFDGSIDTCEHLIVRGATVSDSGRWHRLDVSPDGHFRGAATADDADIAGSFEGELTVHGCLHIRATGSVEGRIAYGSLVVEPGGRLFGTVTTGTDGQRPQLDAIVVPLRPARRRERP